MRSFDPLRLGRLERDAWAAYYRRRWGRVLYSAVGMVRVGFGMPWPRTLYGAWLVLRANRLWAPVPDNDPAGAQRAMQRFYAIVVRAHGEPFDVATAARLEVQWWRVHRHLQREAPQESLAPLVDALAALYSHVYSLPVAEVQLAAAERAAAARISDNWVAAGCDPASGALREERDALVRGYAALLAAVHR